MCWYVQTAQLLSNGPLSIIGNTQHGRGGALQHVRPVMERR
jgi:hypothetical protein